MLTPAEHLVGEIQRVFAEKFAIRVDSPLADLLDTGLIDSLTLVDLLLEVEQRFGVSLPLEELDIEDFRSVARIADLIARRKSSTAASASLAPTPDPTDSANVARPTIAA
ncbi:MAG TPA: acyl carrier protein [Gemmatimonadales bacterium]